MKLLTALLVFLSLSFFSMAQVPVGSWRLHLPCKDAVHVAYATDKVYCATHESIFSYSLKDNSVERLSKITGLSDIEPSAIAYSEEKKLLVIGYENGNIDIVNGKRVTNISDLRNKIIPASKSIHHILFNGKWAYLSCGFGIILLDVEKLEIKDTYVFGPVGTYIQVNSCVIINDELFAATASGIYKANKNDPMLVDFTRWSRVNDIPHNDKAFLQVTSDNNKLYAVYSSPDPGKDTIYYFEDNTWKIIPIEENTDVYNISFSGDQILISTSINLKYYSRQYQLVNTVWQYPGIVNVAPRETYKDISGNIWIADFGSGLIELRNDGGFNQVMPNGPASNRVKGFHYSNNKLFVTAGGTNVSMNNLYNKAEYFVFSGEEWHSYSYPGYFDFMVVKSDPVDKDKIYVGSWGSGVFTYKNGDSINHFDETNSSLQNAIPGGPFTRVAGMDFDQDGNLWMSNSNVNNSLSVLTKDGKWLSFPLRNTIGAELLGDVVVDDFNNIWVALLKGDGIMVLNTNNTIDNADDDVVIKFKPKNAYGATITTVYTLVKDLDGNIWVGTDFGPVYYSNPDEVFEGNTNGIQPTIPRHDGSSNVDPLLGSEIIRSIAVDGANRKWLGTEKGGAFLISADGDSSLLQFNTDNSPILSNTIIGIGIHDKTGEVFLGTDHGIISYRSDANKAEDDFGDVYAFPNPVRPNYHGNITITGLIKDANVKITDIAGNLVYETTTLGGQATWDGNNFDGRRVSSGVYIIFCTNDDGSKTHITKLLFLN